MQYLAGATWKDVLAGRPVTSEEAFKEKARGGKAVAVRCGKCKRQFTMKNVNGLTEPCRVCGGVILPVIDHKE